MKTFSYVLKDPMGLHARPAGLLVKEARKYASRITLTKNGKTVDALRLMAVMTLGCKGGDTLLVTAEGPDEEAAAQGIAQFLSENV